MTAVEWLNQKTSDMTIHKTHLNDTISKWQDGYNVALEDVNKLLNKAKEMEKQQIVDAKNSWFQDDQDGNSSKPLLDEVSFSVGTYSIINENTPKYCHWSEGLKMIISKNGITIKLNSDEIQELVKSLPRTIGGSY